MKKLYRKGTVHPSPPTISDQLSFLPAAILSLTVALFPEEREVLAYLISRSSKPTKNNNTPSRGHGLILSSDHHPACFTCDCFSCYTSYWVKWDSSPNRQLIHEVIDAFEDWLAAQPKPKNNNNKQMRRRKGNTSTTPAPTTTTTASGGGRDELKRPSSEDSVMEERGGAEGEIEKGSLRRFASFVRERIWVVWGPQ